MPHALAFSRAQEVKLQTIPVDPRDPLRGHYLTLGYVFSRAKVPSEVKPGQSIYLPLTKGTSNLWTGGSVQTTRPAGVFLKGRVVYVYDQQASISYGIERFYMEESAARAEDEGRWQAGQTPLIARVQVAPNGAARVVGVERKGKEVR